jgi:hypothetical protein
LPIPAGGRKKSWLTVNNSGCAAFDIRQARFRTAPTIARAVIQAGESVRSVPIWRAAVYQPMPCRDNRATAWRLDDQAAVPTKVVSQEPAAAPVRCRTVTGRGHASTAH